MRIKRSRENLAEGDLTPMIDMTFQLIAFFMVLINFTEADQDDRIKLPKSVLAKPSDGPMETPITIQLTKNSQVVYAGELVSFEKLDSLLIKEMDILILKDKAPAEATVVIRADATAPAGQVQELIQVCQERGFETFTLRAEEEIGY